MATSDELHRDLSERFHLHRRRFLALMAAGAGAVAVAGCTSSGDGSGSDGEQAAAGDAGESADAVDALEPPPADGIDTDPFLLGVASGDPLPTSVLLWTVLGTDLEDRSGRAGLDDTDLEVLWEVATDDTFDTLVATGIEPAPAAFGHSVHVDADGLQPDTWYAYRFRIGDHTSPVGRTRTTPADDAVVDEMTLAFASCQLRVTGHWTAYDHLVDDEPDLVLFLGDYIYEYPGGEGDLAIPLDDEPADLADYRVLWSAYKRDPKIQAAHAVAPWVVTWDDHEVENNYAADVAEKAEDQAAFAARRAAAYQAYWEFQPIRLDPPADDGSLRLHRIQRYGALADFFVLDGRQYRTDQVCGDETPTFASQCPELGDESHSMLGTDQEAWLTDGLTGSEAVWKVLAQQTVMKALVLGDIVFNVDQWDGYPAARRRLLTTIDDGGIDNVMVLTGDIHAGGAADIRVPAADTNGPVVAHELVAPGISSRGIGALGNALDPESIGLAYANFEDNGYVRCTVTPQRWTTEFVVVDTVAEPQSDASVAATVQVEAGTPGIERV